MTRARIRIAAAIATTLAACHDPEDSDDLRQAAFDECAVADGELAYDLGCVDMDPPAPVEPGFCAIDWKTLQFPGSVSLSPVVAAPFDPDLFPEMFPPSDCELPKLFEYDTKEKCEALGQDTTFVRGKFWSTSDELPPDKRLFVIKPDLLHTPEGIVWKDGSTSAVETVDYAFKDYVTTSDLTDLDPCLKGIVCPNSNGIYRNEQAAEGWSCVSDSTWGTNLLNERIAVMCYPPAVDWDGYGPAYGITAKVSFVRPSTPAPAYDAAFIVKSPPED